MVYHIFFKTAVKMVYKATIASFRCFRSILINNDLYYIIYHCNILYHTISYYSFFETAVRKADRATIFKYAKNIILFNYYFILYDIISYYTFF